MRDWRNERLSFAIFTLPAAFWILVLFTLRPVLLRPSMRLLPWLGLLLVASIAFAVQIGGSKYVNFFADQLALFGFIEMVTFIAILIVGYAYAWRRGALAWV